jgi:hypothetical protein
VLASVDELETHLGRELDADQAELFLVLATGAVVAYCGWALEPEDTTMQLDGDGSSVLSLPTLHLVDLTALVVDGVDIDPAGTDWPIWSRKGQLYRRGGWRRHAVIEAEVSHGYDPIPDLLKLVALDLAARQVHNPTGLASVTVGQVSRTWARTGTGDPMALSGLHERLLDRYRL